MYDCTPTHSVQITTDKYTITIMYYINVKFVLQLISPRKKLFVGGRPGSHVQ